MAVGAELANARHARGLSLRELSARTKIKIERLDALEAMAWEDLPRLVYLRGFLRTYAEEVRLDPDDVTERYLDELNETAPGYAEREAHPPPVPDEEFVVRESIWDGDPDYDDIIALDVMRPAPVSDQEVAPTLRPVPAFPRRRIGRYVPVLLVGLMALVAGWMIGAHLERITKPVRSAAVMPYDQDSARETNEDRLARARERAAAAAAELAATPLSATFLSELVPAPLADPAVPAVNATVHPTSVEGRPRDASTLDLSGSWALTNRLDSASADRVEDINLGFHLQLQQRGNRVSGTGERWMENGRSIPVSSRTEILVEGTLSGRRLELNFTERGPAQPTAGKFVMTVTDNETLRGRFVSDAANAHGISLARRMESPGPR
jgi:transcriptional regulator with XRE-family HTH domain